MYRFKQEGTDLCGVQRIADRSAFTAADITEVEKVAQASGVPGNGEFVETMEQDDGLKKIDDDWDLKNMMTAEEVKSRAI